MFWYVLVTDSGGTLPCLELFFSCADFFKWKLECFGGVVLKRVAYNSDHFLASFVLSLPSFHVRWQWRSAATQLSATWKNEAALWCPSARLRI
jgi:hypothetical protein